MTSRVGLGPVYEFERIMQARRWQLYAMRAGFGLGLLSAMAVVWWSGSRPTSSNSLQAYAEIGQAFFLGLSGMQIALVLLAAPAATAGAICLDKQRGSLAHLLVTDLSDAEVILGKLAARLVPVLGMVLAALPIVALATLLGGIDPRALIGTFLVSIGVAVLGCSLALTFSVWASKTHEVLLGTYAALGLWLMAIPMARALGFRGRGGFASGPEWMEAIDPFRLALRPSFVPGSENVTGGALFLLGTLATSAALLALSTRCLRPVAANPRPPKPRMVRVAVASRPSRRWLRNPLPPPSLDRDPVAWREWHRAGPSRIVRMVGVTYVGLAIVFGAMVIGPVVAGGPAPDIMAAWVNALTGSVGLLMLSVTASTSLAEERVRGSLDVLLATPLSTRSILRGKWHGTFRRAVPLAILPGAIALAAGLPHGSFLSWVLIPAYVLAMAAAITSLGLALATWQSRVGRAVALTVSAYLSLTIGWLFVVLMFNRGPMYPPAFFSPFIGLAEGTFILARKGYPDGHFFPGYALSIGSALAAAILLYFATLLTFDRFLGRMPESGRAPRPSPHRREPEFEPAMALD